MPQRTAEPLPTSRTLRLPYGCYELDPLPALDAATRRVRCYVRGCQRQLVPPGRGGKGEVCPEHGIRCHHSTKGGTYSYSSVRRNIIASPDLFASRVIGHPFKYETHRMGNENSEDAVSWNVWRSLQEAGMLGRIGAALTGITARVELRLYLWGLSVSDDTFTPWPLLVAARERFESRLPVERPLTEPDIALHAPGEYLILIEAKFTSPNTFYERGPRKDTKSLTLAELLAIYRDPSLRILDVERALEAERVHYQLWRNLMFAEWMAAYENTATRAFHVNLVREGYEAESAAEFANLVRPDYRDRFRQITWEDLYRSTAGERRLKLLRRYFETKTAGLRPAFAIDRCRRVTSLENESPPQPD